MKAQSIYKRVGTLLLILGPLTTLLVSPWSNFDPINLIKLLAVTSLSFAAFALSITAKDRNRELNVRGLSYLAGFFVVWMLIVLFVSGAPFDQQIWGVFGRNTGFLTYLSLILVLLSTSLVQDISFYKKLVEALVLTAVPTTLYALVQVAGRDPVAWSVMSPFATLGNVNFSSAFFGLASICSVVLIFQKRFNPVVRLLLLGMVILDLLIILKTGSIQGFMIFIAGVGIAIYFWIRAKFQSVAVRGTYLGTGLIGFGLTSLALLNLGPLARFVFGETILYRFDYWFAGWNMTLKNPIFGVGLDSYGDWYRQLRGEIATLRTNPDRITNTAHNIYLDISASGGFPLLIAYLLILGFAARASWRFIRRTSEFDPYFVAMFSAWLAYLIQAAISINQIGVGIWGWLFTGGLIGYEIVTRPEGDSSKRKKGEIRASVNPMPAASALIGILAFAVGFALAFIPFSADMKFKDALQSNSLEALKGSVNRVGSTAYQYELTLDAALKQNNEQEAKIILEGLLARYPRDFMAWQVRSLLPSSSPEERLEAQKRLLDLDPFNNSLFRPQ
jgi:O-antigen ligase